MPEEVLQKICSGGAAVWFSRREAFKFPAGKNCKMPTELLFYPFFLICASHQIVNAGIVVVCKTNQHFNGNVAGACFIMGVGTLADVQNFAELFLLQISICT